MKPHLDIDQLSAEQAWAAVGDMSIPEAISSYGGVCNAAHAAVDCLRENNTLVVDGKFADKYAIGHLLRRIMDYLVA